MNKYTEMRVIAEEAKRKINQDANITQEELEALRYIANTNPSNTNLTAFAVGKRYLKEDNIEENEGN